MTSSIVFFGREIPLYGVCFWSGICVSAFIMLMIHGKRKITWYDMVYSAVFTMIGAMIGSKGLFILVSWKEIVAAGIPWINIIKGGFVFYGGLLGGLAGLITYVSIYKLNAIDFLDIYALVIPIGHAIGRVGCFFAGCCYGIPYDGPFAHTYTETIGQTPLNIPLLPVQLLEALCLVILFAVNMLCFTRRPTHPRRPLYIYLASYSAIRFALEFLRGDRERGIFLGLSTAQWISLLLVAGVVFLVLMETHKSKKATSKTD